MTDLQKAPVTRVDRLKSDYKVQMDALKKQLEDARWDKEKQHIQEKMDQLKSIFKGEIWRAEIDQELAKIALKKQSDAQVARLADQKAEVKNRALQEWVKAGGDPSQFEVAWPSIEQSVLNERVINALLGEKPSEIPIML